MNRFHPSLFRGRSHSPRGRLRLPRNHRSQNAPVRLAGFRAHQPPHLFRQGSYAQRDGWRSPDLILLDLNLPRLTGREVLQRIRATPALRAVPVVVLTTSRRLEDVQQMYEAGANTYVEKPQDFARLVQVLQTIQRYWLDTALLPPLS